jgi:hypothetical protein
MAEIDKITHTSSPRMHVDLRLTEPEDAVALKCLADDIERTLRKHVGGLAEVRVTQIVVPEGERFDWSKLNGSEADRG